MKRLWFHSANGEPWERIEPSPRSIVFNADLPEDDIWDDGFGNRYYWTRDLGDPVPAGQRELARGIGALLLVVVLVVIL